MGRNRVGKVVNFSCDYCSESIQVYRNIEDIERDEICPTCCEAMKRIEVHKRNYRCFTPHFHDQLGEFVYTRDDERSAAKKNGMVDISGAFKKGDIGNWRRK